MEVRFLSKCVCFVCLFFSQKNYGPGSLKSFREFLNFVSVAFLCLFSFFSFSWGQKKKGMNFKNLNMKLYFAVPKI